MNGAMGWGKRAALCGLALGLGAAAWAGNPDGQGVFNLELSGMSGYTGESGTYVPHPVVRTYHLYTQLESDDSWGLGYLFAVNPRWSMDAGASMEDAVDHNGETDLTTAHYYDVKNETQSLHASLGARCYLASYFDKDWNPDTDHPEGVLLWPTLWARALWYQGSTQATVLDNVGYTLTLPADLGQQSASLSLGVVLPLSPDLAVTGSFTRNLFNMAQQGGASSSNLGSSDSFDAGASYHLWFRDPDPGQDYFPRVGRPGQLLFSADVFSTRAIAQDSNLAAGLNASATVPFFGRYTVALGWNWIHQYHQPYDNVAYFTPVVQGQDPQNISLTVGYSFGDAARAQSADAASPPPAMPAKAAQPSATPSGEAQPADATPKQDPDSNPPAQR